MNKQLSWGWAVVIGGVAAGVLDAVDAVIAFGTQGFNPVQIYQFVASGALGASAFRGGAATALLGLAVHFVIAFTAAALYVGASRRFTGLTQYPIGYGLLYGVGVYVVMNYGVIPLSAIKPAPFSLPMFLNGVVGHALLVGLPIALVTARTARV